MREAVGAHIHELHSPVCIWGVSGNMQLRLDIAGEGERLTQLIARINQHILTILGRALIDRSPHCSFDRARVRDRTRRHWIRGIRAEIVGGIVFRRSFASEASTALARVRFSIGTQMERRRSKALRRPGLCVAPNVVAHRKIAHWRERLRKGGCVLFEVTIEPVELLSKRIN